MRRKLTRSVLGVQCLESRETPAVFFVDNASDFIVTTDQGAVGLDSGDTVTWNPGIGSAHGGQVQNLTLGTNAFTSVQAAVNAAAAGDTIRVASGAFAEQVNVNKQVTLLGNQFGIDARTRSSVAETVVDGATNAGRTPFYITANNVTLDGFTVQGATNSNVFGFGILLGAGTSGAHVLDNIVQNNIVGLGLANGASGNAALIQHNLFQNNNAAGPAGGNAIYSDEYVAGPLANVTIDANRFAGHDDAALNLSSTTPGSQSGITFSNNDVVDNGRAAFLYNLVNSTFSNNTVSSSTFAASADFRIYGGVHNVSFTGNDMSKGAGDAFRITDSSGTNPNSNILITGNSIAGYAGDSVEIASGYTGGPLNANGNWWGTSSAADISPRIKGNVDYMAFLTSGVDTDLLTHGFQGDTSVAAGEGNVRVSVYGKQLLISGDNLNNMITITQGPTANSYRVTGMAGTHINGRSGSFVFQNVTRGIVAYLNGGNDVFVLDGSASPINVPGIIYVRTGTGDDLVSLQGVSGKADLGSYTGNDLFQLSDSDFSALTVYMGNGKSTNLFLDDVNVTGRTSVFGSYGADTIRALDSNFNSLLVQTGYGNDTVSLDGVHATGRVQIDTYYGNDTVAFSNSNFGAAVALNGWLGADAFDAGILGNPNTKGNTFAVAPVVRGFDSILS